MRPLPLALLGLGLALAAPARAATLRGQVTDTSTQEALAGVTVVASADGVFETAITEDDGGFAIEVPAGTYLITFFYGDVTIERSGVVIGEAGLLDLRQRIDTASQAWSGGCYFGPATAPIYDGAPTDRADRDPADVPLVRVQDHRGIAALDARLRPRHAATTLGGAVRLPGAPAIASELLDAVATSGVAAAIDQPGATGGVIDVAVRHGSNTHQGRSELQLGPRARFMTHDAGALVHDHAWWSTGVVLERASGRDGGSGRHGGQVMLALDGAADPGDAPAVALVGLMTWTPTGGRDAWADGRVTFTGDDAHREVVVGISAEAMRAGAAGAPLARVDAPAGAPALAAVDRVAGRLGLTQRGRWHGPHTLTVGGELGLGQADGVDHGDQRAYLGDEWTPRPTWTITGGVRWDRRELGPARVDAVTPRVAVVWDPSEEGTRVWYATAERLAALDQDRFGGWRAAAAVGADQVSLGYTRDWLDDLRVTLAARARRAVGDAAAPVERGGELAVRWLPQGRFAGELTASSLTRRLVTQASYTVARGRTSIAGATVAEVGADEHHWGASLAAARGAPGSYTDATGVRIDLRMALELFDLEDARARGGRLTMSASW